MRGSPKSLVSRLIVIPSLALASCTSAGVQQRTWIAQGDRFETQPATIPLNESGQIQISIPDLPSVHLSLTLALPAPSGDNRAFLTGGPESQKQFPGLDADLDFRVRNSQGELLIAHCDIFRRWGWGGTAGASEVVVHESFGMGPLSGPLLVSLVVIQPSSKPALARFELWATRDVLIPLLPPNKALELTGRRPGACGDSPAGRPPGSG